MVYIFGGGGSIETYHLPHTCHTPAMELKPWVKGEYMRRGDRSRWALGLVGHRDLVYEA
jgi:hypothetical protein